MLKYTRNRSAVPALMVKQLIKDIAKEHHPAQDDVDTLLMDAAEAELETVEFFIKKPSPGSSYEYCFHCSSSVNQESTACNRYSLSDCLSVGEVLPDASVLCKVCARARPEAASFHGAEPS